MIKILLGNFQIHFRNLIGSFGVSCGLHWRSFSMISRRVFAISSWNIFLVAKYYRVIARGIRVWFKFSSYPWNETQISDFAIFGQFLAFFELFVLTEAFELGRLFSTKHWFNICMPLTSEPIITLMQTIFS